MVKVETSGRMQQSNKRKNTKDSSETSERSSRKNTTAGSSSGSKKSGKPAPKLRRGKRDDDDESVDSKGNIRGLITYSEEDDEASEEDSEVETTEEETPRTRKSTRAAALKAQKALKKKAELEDDDEEEEEEKPRRRRGVIRRKSPKRKEEEEDDEEEEEEEEEKPRRYRGLMRRKSPKRKEEEEEEEEDDDDDDEDEYDDEEDDEDDEDDEEDDDYEEGGRPGGISISFGGFDDEERMVPKRHNMKKESEIVKKFVKLLQNPFKENTIDDQIDMFKTLGDEKQKQMVAVLDRKNSPATAEQPLMFRILSMNVPPETQSMILNKYNSLQALDSSSGEYFKLRSWLEKITSVPLGIYKEMPVRIDDGTEKCGAFMERAKRSMEDAIYGQDEAKMQILQFIASKIANPNARGLSLLLVGPPGIGKTSLIKNGIAKALEWPFQFISLGGDSDATTYTGHQLVYESSHCGKIVNSLVAAKSMSMVLMFDELDKISGTPKGEEVQNMLVHLTDPVQNADFEDKYLSGVPIDLSKVMFVFSGNDLNKIDRILMDRMIVVRLSGYSAKEKQAIAELYLVPAALRELNLAEKVGLSSEVIAHIIREYSGEETGVRELKRCVETVVQKINMLRIFNSKDLPFHIKDFSLPFVVKKEHVDLFLKKKEPDTSVSQKMMYC